ncbi:MAG TPA: hypothetical protein VGP48_00780 [Stellaceae bacterium]|nr:hypothetical protein [Stellaceae bacterium]
MPVAHLYRCSVVDQFGHVVVRYEVAADTDVEAIAQARIVYDHYPYGGYGLEVWEDARYVHCEYGRPLR